MAALLSSGRCWGSSPLNWVSSGYLFTSAVPAGRPGKGARGWGSSVEDDQFGLLLPILRLAAACLSFSVLKLKRGGVGWGRDLVSACLVIMKP